MLPKFSNETDMQVCLLKFGISAYFFNTLNQKYLQSFVRFTSIEVILIYCVFLPMFGNLRLYEIHQTPTSYQVLSMQIRLVNHLR